MVYFTALSSLLCVFLFTPATKAICTKGSEILQTGEKYRPVGECIEITCAENGAYTALGCPLIRVDEASGYTLSETDTTKQYPDCCPQPIPPPSTTVDPFLIPCLEEGKIYEIGEQRDIPGYCGLNVCAGNNQWTQAACGLLGVPEGYTVTEEDPSKPYPECCAKVVPK